MGMLRRDGERSVPIRQRINVLTIVLIIFVIISFLLNAYTFAAIYQTRRVVRAHLDAAATKIGEARQQTIHYDFPIQQTFPVSTTIQLNETIVVPINLRVPIKETINVPIEVPLFGQFDLPVPLDFSVPVSTTVTVPIDKVIPIATEVDLNTSIPLEVDLSQAPLGDVLRDLEAALRDLLTQF